MRIAVTADLHWGHSRRGDETTRLLKQHLVEHPVDLLLLGGDLGTADHFGACLELFADLPCTKAVVPGNHDLWVVDHDTRGDSLFVYQQHLPGLCAWHGYHYLDTGPLVLPDADLAVVGSVNWYDYSWSIDRLRAEVPDWEWHLRNKAFSRGRHNDGKFIRWPTDDVRFTAAAVANLARHLREALTHVGRAIVLTHHPAFYGLGFPREGPPQGLDGLLWDALSGNAGLERVLRKHADRIALIFSGHTHRAVQAALGPAAGYNVGGDYHFKRMLVVDWPAGGVEAHQFGDPARRQ
jgi:3',5'-cyclic AMP phosphodiesterase CpdA